MAAARRRLVHGASLRVQSGQHRLQQGGLPGLWTSACADLTPSLPAPTTSSAVHLRACGLAPSLTCGCVVALPLRDVGAGRAARAVCPAFRADDACHGSDSLKWAVVGSSWSLRVQSGREDGDAPRGQPRCISACAEWTFGPRSGRTRTPVHLCVCGVDAAPDDENGRGLGASLRVRSVRGPRPPRPLPGRCISARAE